MFKKILIPVDGSETSNAGLALGLELAREGNASVVLCYVIDYASPSASWALGVGLSPGAIESARRIGEELLHDTALQASMAGVASKTLLRSGDVAREILAAVHECGIDLIVMGSHGRSGLARGVLGSITEAVMRHARVPVLVTHARVRLPSRTRVG